MIVPDMGGVSFDPVRETHKLSLESCTRCSTRLAYSGRWYWRAILQEVSMSGSTRDNSRQTSPV